MSLEFPIQTRTIDPYSSYNSNVVNQLTRLVTRGKNCLFGIHAIDVELDPASSDTNIVILPGECFKDDVIIQIDEETNVDMSVQDYYISHLSPWNEAGYYYVCLEYTYAKARPAPEAKIRLLKPSQTSLYDADTSAYLLLKVVKVIFNGTTFEIDELFDYDPVIPENKRGFTQLYAGSEDTLNTFVTNQDEGRLIYVKDRDELYFGISNRWESFNAIRAHVDTMACVSGDLGYIAEDGTVSPAIATSLDALADCVVLASGTSVSGQVRLYGETFDVKIETGIDITKGESLYLSRLEAGTVTNLKPFEFAQFIGVSVSTGVVSGECDIWFLPDRTLSVSISNNDPVDFYQDLLQGSIFEYLCIETFGNKDLFDVNVTTAEIDTSDYSLIGGTGDIYQSLSLQVSDYASQLEVAQVSSKSVCVNSGEIQWYISNHGSNDLDWEEVELDTIHNFSTYRLEISTQTGTFVVGEDILSSSSNKISTINGINSGRLLVFGDTKQDFNYQIGETVTGLVSGAVGEISSFVNRQQDSYHDLRIKLVMSGGATDCKVYDYGVIYDQDEDIFNYDTDVVKNVETLYLDVYTTPHQDEDGSANLSTPLETQITNLRYDVILIDSTSIERFDQLESDTAELDNRVDYIYSDELPTLQYQMNSVDQTLEELTEQVEYISDATAFGGLELLPAYADNDLDTLYADVYAAPTRNHDGDPNLITPLETQIIQLRDFVDTLELDIEAVVIGINPVIYITSSDSSPNVASVPSMIRIDYIGVLTITNFLYGSIGQEVVIVFTNSNTTIEHNSNISLLGSINFTSNDEECLTLIYNGTKWIEKSRNVTTYA